MRISHEEHIYEGSVKATVKTFFGISFVLILLKVMFARNKDIKLRQE